MVLEKERLIQNRRRRNERTRDDINDTVLGYDIPELELGIQVYCTQVTEDWWRNPNSTRLSAKGTIASFEERRVREVRAYLGMVETDGNSMVAEESVDDIFEESLLSLITITLEILFGGKSIDDARKRMLVWDKARITLRGTRDSVVIRSKEGDASKID